MGDALGTTVLVGAASIFLAMSAMRAVQQKKSPRPVDIILEVNGYRNTIGASEGLRSGANRHIGEPKAVDVATPAGTVAVSLPSQSNTHPIRHNVHRGRRIATHC